MMNLRSITQLFNTTLFAGVFAAGLLFTGAFIPILIAFIAAAAITFIVRTYLTNKRLSVGANEYVLITGTSSGIGRDAAISLSSLGFYVFAGVRKESDIDSLNQLGNPRILPLVMDVTNQSEVARGTEYVRETLTKNNGKLIALVHNAGYAESVPLEMLSRESLRYQFEVNAFPCVDITNSFLPLLRAGSSAQRSARIVFISSGLSYLVVPALSAYSATKLSMESFASAYSMELKKWNIDTSIIVPGRTKTAFSEAARASHQESVKKAQDSGIHPDILNGYLSGTAILNEFDAKSARYPVEVVTSGIVDAILDSVPLARYLVGPDVALAFVAKFIPDDLIRKAVGGPFAPKQ